MATNDNGLAAVMYNSCTTTARVGDGTGISLVQETRYPFEEDIRFVVKTGKKVTFPLYLRVPGWCHNTSVKSR